MTKYVLNSAVITTAGTYEYRIISLDEAKEWLKQPFLSTLGYQETADALSLLTGVTVGVNRTQIKMQAGDEALVFRLICRLDNPALKGQLTEQFILENCEIGILKKIN